MPSFSYDIPVLVIKYFPLDPNDSTKIDRNITGSDLAVGTTLEQVKQKIRDLNSELVASLTIASAYHRYQDSIVTPALNYRLFEEKEF